MLVDVLPTVFAAAGLDAPPVDGKALDRAHQSPPDPGRSDSVRTREESGSGGRREAPVGAGRRVRAALSARPRPVESEVVDDPGQAAALRRHLPGEAEAMGEQVTATREIVDHLRDLGVYRVNRLFAPAGRPFWWPARPAPALAVGVAAGAPLGEVSPLAGAGLAAMLVLCFLPWAALITLLFLASIQQNYVINMGGFTLRFEQILLIPFTVQAILMSRGARLNRWRMAEWLVALFVLFEVFTTYVHGFFSLKNFAPIGLAVFGATAYLTVMMSVNTRARLIFASRVMLVGLVVNAAWGTLGFASAILFGTTFAVSKGLKELVKPAFGFAYESNIFG